MVKRKKARKTEAKTKAAEFKQEFKEIDAVANRSIPVPALAIKILSGILAAIMIAALTLYVIGMMPARGFWTLAIILALLAFVVIPVMRKKFVEHAG